MNKKPTNKKYPLIRVTQIGSPIGRRSNHRSNLIGLGLNKLHRSRELESSPEILGMVDKVKHLLLVESK